MVKVKILLVILATLLFAFNYQICDFFYPTDSQEDINGWWDLKSNMYAIILATSLLSQMIGSKGVLKLFLSIGFGFALSNVIDKVLFNVRYFTTADLFMIVLTISIAMYNYLTELKNAHNK